MFSGVSTDCSFECQYWVKESLLGKRAKNEKMEGRKTTPSPHLLNTRHSIHMDRISACICHSVIHWAPLLCLPVPGMLVRVTSCINYLPLSWQFLIKSGQCLSHLSLPGFKRFPLKQAKNKLAITTECVCLMLIVI